MHVAGILDRKGAFVATVPPDCPLLDLATHLARFGVGALVVSNDGTTIDGIVSERDLARAVARDGAAALSLPVASVMVREVRTCVATDSTDELMATMTEARIRHMPVVEDGRLTGIVSIGDVVKHRLDELQSENGTLHEYLYSGR